MMESYERKKDKRSTQMGATILTEVTSGRHCYATLSCISCRSMYFETNCDFKSGNKIDIQFSEPPLAGSLTNFSATVYWCMLLSEDEPTKSYGIGVKYT
jgi:hypothetical protein